jgi:hypothetical protein
VIAVAGDAGWKKDRGEPVEELEGGEAESGTTGGVGLRQDVEKDVEDLVGTVADEVEPFQRKRWSGTVAKESFEAGAVGGLDTDTPIQLNPPPVIPGQHVLGLVGFQEAVAGKVAIAARAGGAQHE